MSGRSTLAVLFGNRGVFPASLQTAARREMSRALKRLGHRTLMTDLEATPHGAIETVADGEIFAKFLRSKHGSYDGVILCLPNFGDETGAVAALKDVDVPILIQAYPDELDKMGPKKRRDAFCGKISVMDVFCQYGLPFTALRPHVVHPESEKFAENIAYFDRLCCVVAGMKDLTVGSIGARTTPFKTVRFDELALQKFGITVETVDLSDVFARMKSLDAGDRKVKAKAARLKRYCLWTGVPETAFVNLVRLGVALDSVIDELRMQAVAIRCWTEMQQQLGVSPCVLLSEMNDRGLSAACEVDVANAVTMHALSLASGDVATCLDWNNNYGEEEDKCILFHCGPVPNSMMVSPGQITDHAILANAVGKGCSFGPNTGRIAPTPMTFGSMLTRDGDLEFYLGEGSFTDDPIPEGYFGCAGVAQVPDLQTVLQAIGYLGHRHHVSATPGHVLEPVLEAFEKYLGYEVTVL